MLTPRYIADSTVETRVYDLRRLLPEFKPEEVARAILQSVNHESWRIPDVLPDDNPASIEVLSACLVVTQS